MSSCRYYFRRLTLPDSAAGEVPLDPIRRAHQQQRLTDVDSHKCPFMLLVPQSPPDAGKRETDAVCCPPGSVEKRVQGLTWINLYYLCRLEGQLFAGTGSRTVVPATSCGDPEAEPSKFERCPPPYWCEPTR
jgi:hypothetical protein